MTDDDLNEACECVEVMRLMTENADVAQADGDVVLLVHPDQGGAALTNYECACVLSRMDNARFDVWRGSTPVSARRFLPHFASRVRANLPAVRTKQDLLEAYMLHYENSPDNNNMLLLAFVVRSTLSFPPFLFLATHSGKTEPVGQQGFTHDQPANNLQSGLLRA